MKIEVNFANLNIESFEQYHCTLNYDNNFYFSGGYNSLKIFCRYNEKDNIFIPLKEMPTPHYYHGMLGMNNCIFIISGLKSKKVEKYDIIHNTWENLSELKDSRTWPSSFSYKNRYIFVFGGICNNYLNEANILIEKLDINSVNKRWEQLILNDEYQIKLPYSFGLVHIYDNSFLLIGGKYNSSQNNFDSYKFVIDEKKIDIKKDKELKLAKQEEFNGKMFSNFGNNYFGEFSSFSHDKFYLIDFSNKSIDIFD